MKHFLIFAALVAAAPAWGKWNEGLSVRFGVGLGAGRLFFIPVPQTLREAKNARWVESTRSSDLPLPHLTLYTPSINDVVLGALYDQSGEIAGLQVALPQDSFTDAAFDFGVHGYTNWTAPANAQGVVRNYWITAVYFVSEATLAKSHEERVATRKGRVLQEDNIYVTSFKGDLMAISTVASEVADTDKTLFTRQACVPYMGRHYYYNMSSTTECSSEGLLPWFPLLDLSKDSDQLIGVGFFTGGRLPAASLVRDYFERSTEWDVRNNVNNGPECLYELAANPGALTMHIYFVDSPLLINCFFT